MKNTLSTLITSSATLQKSLQRLPEFLSLLLIVASAYTLANISWGLLPVDETPMPKPLSVITNGAKSNSTQHFRQLSNAHLFGIVNKQTNATPASAPVTKLSLVLKGVLAALPMSYASAIIAERINGPEDIYSIGDRLPGNVTIKEIHPNHVIIDRGGQLETLELQDDSDAEGFTTTITQNPASQPEATSLNEVREQILKDPTSFGDYALPIVVKENNKQIGYRLDLQDKGAIFTAAGLLPTDIITSVNGMALDSPQKSMRALRSIKTSDQLNLIVKRDGADVSINLRLQ